MRMGTNAAGQFVAWSPGRIAPLPQTAGARPVTGAQPVPGAVRPQGAPIAITADCAELGQRILYARAQRDAQPFRNLAYDVWHGRFEDAVRAAARGGCNTRLDGTVAPQKSYPASQGDAVISAVDAPKPGDSYQYVAANPLANVPLKAAGQIPVGDTSNSSTLIGLLMLGGAGYIGYRIGKKSR